MFSPADKAIGRNPWWPAFPLVLLATIGLVALTAIDREPTKTAAGGPPPVGFLATFPPGSPLPSEDECAIRVRRSPWEPRPGNRAANGNVPTAVSLPGFTPEDGGVDARARALADRVSGNFTGTTDEIIQWAACKWGFSDDLTRAVAVQESSWNQDAVGDMTTVAERCQEGYSVPCPESFGLMQIKARFNPGTFPLSLTSTAFNVDYALMNRRICFEGWLNWLHDEPGYRAGDEWGCVGLHYSGHWMDDGALRYISRVRAKLDNKSWLSRNF